MQKSNAGLRGCQDSLEVSPGVGASMTRDERMLRGDIDRQALARELIDH